MSAQGPRRRARAAGARLRGLVVAMLALGGAAVMPAGAPSARAGGDVPEWLAAAASLSVPTYAPSVDAVVLHDEERVVIEKGGRAVRTCRYAVRILTREGAARAVARVDYNTDGGKVRDLSAWVIPPAGGAKPRELGDAIDATIAGGALYTEARARLISATNEVVPGSVFGFESILDDWGVLKQYEWMFQDRLPALLSRFSVETPSGWAVAGVTLNHAPIAPTAAGTVTTWEVRDLPPIDEEPASPPLTAVAPRLAVTATPPASSGARAGSGFQDWRAVSQWIAALADPRAASSPALAARAQALTAGAKTDRERIESIARFVQGVRYVSIQMGLARGGGFTPRPATDVLETSYGDCKDKANLMKALLACAGIQSDLAAIYSGDPGYVQEAWPSPEQFNHCIIAIRTADFPDGPVIQDPPGGALLLFDPTNPFVPLGGLPAVEQGSLALLVAGDSGRLVRAPLLPAERNRMERTIDVTLQADGAVAASLRERSSGSQADDERQYHHELPPSEYARAIERWIARGVGGVKVARTEAREDSASGQFVLDVSFEAKQYAQVMSPRLLAFRPLLVERRERLAFTEPKRTLPIVLRASALEERVRASLPEGFAVEDLPAPLTLQSDFGAYSLRCENSGGRLVVTRSLHVQGTRLPPERYDEVRAFFGRIREAEQTPLVLSR